MTGSPGDAVRIDDLVDPVFPPGVAEALAGATAALEAIDWTPQAVLDAAIAEAGGLDDFGDDFDEPVISDGLAMQVRVAAESTRLSDAGKLSAWRSLVEAARNRLLVVDQLRRHPEIADIEIRRPIVIAGQARTGTTHLHNLISSDPALRSLPYWESLEPVPPLDEQGRSFDVDPRWERCAQKTDGLDYALPLFKRMHDMYPDHVHEEIQLMATAFGGMLFESGRAEPAWRDWYLASDQTPVYRWTRTVLQVLTYLGGGDRWVLKSPQHVEQIGPLMAAFPDAVVVFTHRDPVEVTASVSTMIAYTARMSHRAEALADVGRYWVDRIERMFRAGVDQREVVSAEQSMDVRFDDFMADDIAMVRRIYELADQPFDDSVEAHMAAFMADHPRGKHGRIIYDLSMFGVDPTEREQALAFYRERFL